MDEVRKHLLRYNTEVYDERFFKNYLKKCDNSFSCLQKIDAFFKLKKMYPEYLLPGDMDNLGFENFCKSVYSFYLPELNSDGCRVFIDKVTADENLFDVLKIMKYYCMQTELRFLHDEADQGDIILFDCNKIDFFFIIAFIPYFIRSLLLVLTIYPLKLKVLVLINVGKIAETVITIIKLFSPTQYRKLVFAYAEGFENFSNHVSSRILPREYGGEIFTLDELREQSVNKLKYHHIWFKKAKDEIIRMPHEKLEQFDQTFGINGTFRLLELD